MPEHQVACTRQHAHPFELGAGDDVAMLTVCGMKPEHIRLGAPAQMLDNRGVQLCFGLGAVAHDAPRRRHSGMGPGSLPSSSAYAALRLPAEARTSLPPAPFSSLPLLLVLGRCCDAPAASSFARSSTFSAFNSAFSLSSPTTRISSWRFSACSSSTRARSRSTSPVLAGPMSC